MMTRYGRSTAALVVILLAGSSLFAQPKRLNNLVTELATSDAVMSGESISFTNPRRGWVFVSAGAGEGAVTLFAGDKPDVLISGKQAGGEAMRFLSPGQYQVKIIGGDRQDVTVRAIPAILFIGYMKLMPNPSGIENHTNDWDFLRRYIHPHINTLAISRGRYGMPTDEQFREWEEHRKRWLVEIPLPFIKLSRKEMLKKAKSGELIEAFKQLVGLKDPRVDGVLLDELVSKEAYETRNLAWVDAIRKLKQDAQYENKEFYLYVNQPKRQSEDYKQMADLCVQYDCPVVVEVYPHERVIQGKDAESVFAPAWNAAMRENWRKLNPRMDERIMIALGGLNIPWTNCDVDPGLNYKVWLDMYFQFVATDPSWNPTQGVGFWTSHYADEELLRWEARLLRHYAIEGRRDRLSSDPYELDHLDNPDIDEGVKGWDLQPAADGSITVGSIPGYGSMQGRFRYMGGNYFLVTRRGASGPNRIQQTVKNLTPGRRYTLRMYTGDLNEFKTGKSRKSMHSLNIQLKGAKIDDQMQKPYRGKAPLKRAVLEANHAEMPQGMDNAPIETEGTPCWLNYHWVLFRAEGPTAELVVSDWKDDDTPGGPEGQELMFNFFQVEPYFEPDSPTPGGL